MANQFLGQKSKFLFMGSCHASVQKPSKNIPYHSESSPKSFLRATCSGRMWLLLLLRLPTLPVTQAAVPVATTHAPSACSAVPQSFILFFQPLLILFFQPLLKGYLLKGLLFTMSNRRACTHTLPPRHSVFPSLTTTICMYLRVTVCPLRDRQAPGLRWVSVNNCRVNSQLSRLSCGRSLVCNLRSSRAEPAALLNTSGPPASLALLELLQFRCLSSSLSG